MYAFLGPSPLLVAKFNWMWTQLRKRKSEAGLATIPLALRIPRFKTRWLMINYVNWISNRVKSTPQVKLYFNYK